MHRAYLFAATMLLGIASLSFTALAISMPRENAVAGDSKHQEQIVRRFYDAVNLQIETGDSSALVEVLHPDFTDEHPFSGVTPGPAEMVEYVDSLHTRVPESRIEVESIATNDDDVMALVNIHQYGDSNALRSWQISPSSIWNPIERFRIAGDRIIERSSSNRELVMLHEQFALPMDLETSGHQDLTATYLTFQENGSARFQTSAGSALLHVISGELAITIGTSRAELTIHIPPTENEQSSKAQTLPPGEVVTMVEGSSLTIPTGVYFTAISSRGPVSALYVSTTEVSPLGQGIQTGLYSSEGVAVRDLGWFASNELPAGSFSMTMNRISLLPGASVWRSNEPGTRAPLMWLDTGTVLTELDKPAANGAGATQNNQLFVSGVQLSPGDGLAYLWSSGATLHNTSDEPAMVWTISVE